MAWKDLHPGTPLALASQSFWSPSLEKTGGSVWEVTGKASGESLRNVCPVAGEAPAVGVQEEGVPPEKVRWVPERRRLGGAAGGDGSRR